ncbi:HAMP domain-containing sensor histidine kinase [Paenibacillus sp.]|uniref:HAMP domain-containing sensor histidine kinase n=1 Tax=Paenibacillus sp. TaxID=58172 RepID=UPI002D3A1011|nr:HAMP domain-containing sensor histidine kinase [Paenibacillus sp.]HZG84754.1 HAMP domain-containing sensor histidine kinase [Paenibacillus sp.]
MALAIVLLPVSFIVMTMLLYEPVRTYVPDGNGGRLTEADLERLWHEEASTLAGAPPGRVERRLAAWKESYPEASVVWVDASGRTRLQLPGETPFPDRWTLPETIRFMKEGYDSDPFTVVALLGEEGEGGFLAIQLPRSLFSKVKYGAAEYAAIVGVLLVLALFMALSAFFFFLVRRRLLRLRDAMTSPAEDGLPRPVAARRPDEIGLLEEAFNEMLAELKRSRAREREEESLRRRLIANLSHDLRTPLTAIRGHAHRLGQEADGAESRESAALIDRKIGQMDRLIDNLLSYTLLSAGKYPYRPQPTDVVRLARMSVAGWYPVFEREGFEVDVDLPDRPVLWEIDPAWLERVIDNVFQNVLRHASDGKYVGLRLRVESNDAAALSIEDRGPGMTGDSPGKGAGIGLSIAEMMLREMRLQWSVDTGPGGTTAIIRAAATV